MRVQRCPDRYELTFCFQTIVAHNLVTPHKLQDMGQSQMRDSTNTERHCNLTVDLSDESRMGTILQNRKRNLNRTFYSLEKV